MLDDHVGVSDVADTQPVAVAFVSSYGGLGGGEIYLERLLSNLGRRWIGSVTLLGDGPLVGRLRRLGVPVDVIPTGSSVPAMLRSSWRLRRGFLMSRPVVVHANGLKAALASAVAAVGTRVRVVWVRHDFSFEGWRARALARRCGAVVCVSDALTRTFRGRIGRRVHLVRTGLPEWNIERSTASRRLSELLGDRSGDPVVSLVAQLVPGKGHLELVEITPELIRRLPDARILFVGGEAAGSYGASYLEKLRRRIEEIGVGNHIEFMGHRDDVLTFIAGSDLVVMPSVASDAAQTEGFPLVGLESLAIGTPLVAYSVGGLPELAGDCGHLVSPGDRKGLLEAIVRVATDRSESGQRSARGRERVRARFSMAGMIGGLQQVYRVVERT
jgi:glycosyltransferase involved in cell wall biosynthesis